MSIEYVTVWNGVNDGKDGDVLRPDLRCPEKRIATAPTPPVDGQTTFERVIAIMPTSKLYAMTLMEIAAAADVPKQTANTALYRLRQRGDLASFAIVERRSRPPQRYYLKGPS